MGAPTIPRTNSHTDVSDSGNDKVKSDGKAEKSAKNPSKFSLKNLIPGHEKSEKMKRDWVASIEKTSRMIERVNAELEDIGKDLDEIIKALKALNDFSPETIKNLEKMKDLVGDAQGHSEAVKSNFNAAGRMVNKALKISKSLPADGIPNADKKVNKKIKDVLIRLDVVMKDVAGFSHTPPKLAKGESQDEKLNAELLKIKKDFEEKITNKNSNLKGDFDPVIKLMKSKAKAVFAAYKANEDWADLRKQYGDVASLALSMLKSLDAKSKNYKYLGDGISKIVFKMEKFDDGDL